MTTINDISDLVRILQEDPAWAEAVRSLLLSQELQKLPEVVAELTKAFKQHAENANLRLEALEAGQERLAANQAQTQTTVDGIQTTVTGLETTVDGIQTAVTGLETTVDGIQTAVNSLETTVGGIQTTVTGLETTVTGLQTTVNVMRGEIGNISDSFFQKRAANFALRVARRDFQLRQTFIVHHADIVGDSLLRQMLDEAAEDTSVEFTEEDAAEVELADSVTRGENAHGQDEYVLAVASITVGVQDVDRAKDRADLLKKAAQDAEVHAVVIGNTITADAETLLRGKGVTFERFAPRTAQTGE